MGDVKRRNRGQAKPAATRPLGPTDMAFFERIVQREVRQAIRESQTEPQLHHAIH